MLVQVLCVNKTAEEVLAGMRRASSPLHVTDTLLTCCLQLHKELQSETRMQCIRQTSDTQHGSGCESPPNTLCIQLLLPLNCCSACQNACRLYLLSCSVRCCYGVLLPRVLLLSACVCFPSGWWPLPTRQLQADRHGSLSSLGSVFNSI